MVPGAGLEPAKEIRTSTPTPALESDRSIAQPATRRCTRARWTPTSGLGPRAIASGGNILAVSPRAIVLCSDSAVTESADTIERAYRVRLRLKPAQQRQLLRLFGARRFVWNWAFRRKDEAWRADGTKLYLKALSAEFTQLKTAPETA